MRQEFWPIAGRSTVRRIIGKCITCFRIKPGESQCIMGDLPASRVWTSRPFQICGVDYGGPLYIKESRRRNAKTRKAYLAIFVCFATRAVHLKLVDNLSSEAFLGALKRFMARRGKVSHIYSDNGTNFVGACRELQELRALFVSEQRRRRLERFLAADYITWHFIPPNAPTFGGLW
ncbi:uncharacterized protein LOC105833454 [Monomorium pharaonis]|uniref:uncharacterized protein LOC105833454 n=1 Tax=Monomorium pharaonis TaxID=307658 RepID=UPI00063F25A0|nr:uncharacterized protein LOC105833454 [Monomorium pharaonis]